MLLKYIGLKSHCYKILIFYTYKLSILSVLKKYRNVINLLKRDRKTREKVNLKKSSI